MSLPTKKVELFICWEKRTNLLYLLYERKQKILLIGVHFTLISLGVEVFHEFLKIWNKNKHNPQYTHTLLHISLTLKKSNVPCSCVLFIALCIKLNIYLTTNLTYNWLTSFFSISIPNLNNMFLTIRNLAFDVNEPWARRNTQQHICWEKKTSLFMREHK